MNFLQNVRKGITKQEQMSESLILSLLLALSGGFQDAYTYIERGHVFANAQTGNVVLMSASVLDGNIDNILRYINPLLAFVVGIIIADLIEHHMKKVQVIHWRQMIIMAEVIIMFVSGILRAGPDGKRRGVPGLRHAGGDIQVILRKCLCQHYDHREYEVRHPRLLQISHIEKDT